MTDTVPYDDDVTGEPGVPRSLGLLSVVAPIYNEQELIEEFYSRVCKALTGFAFELVLVDDGSSDGTSAILQRLAAEDPRVHVVYLSRNFGHQRALTAGLDHAGGDAVVMLDADLQDPPELIPRMVDHWRAGCDVVYAVREHREGESHFKLTTARWFYKLFDKLTQVNLHHNSGDFRLLDRRPLNALLSMREHSRFLRGMTVWVGYRQAAVPYRRDPRYAGETKYTLPKMLRFSLDAIFSFSDRPLQLATLLGFLVSTLALVAIPVVVILRLTGSYLPGFGTITIAILLLGGIQLVAIGIIGEYVGRIYDEVKGRPLYLVRSRLNFGDEEMAAAPLSPVETEGLRTEERRPVGSSPHRADHVAPPEIDLKR
jgi:dolichol-phosphate mannosyltransferase